MGRRCVKYSFFVFNFLFFLYGFALIVAGTAIAPYIALTFGFPDIPTAIFFGICFSVIEFIVFIGFYGALERNRFIFKLLISLLVLISIIHNAAVIIGFSIRDQLPEILKDRITQIISTYNKLPDDLRETVDQVQSRLHCCGVNNASDWSGFRPDGMSVPDSCCVSVSLNCGKEALAQLSKVHPIGCYSAVAALMKKQILWVILASAVIAFLPTVSLVFTCLLMRNIRRCQLER